MGGRNSLEGPHLLTRNLLASNTPAARAPFCHWDQPADPARGLKQATEAINFEKP